MLENFGIGIDIVDVNQFEKIPYSKNPKFYKKIFHLAEINYCLKYKNPHTHFAGKFAVKEAVKKSMRERVSLLNIITYHSNSKPRVKLVNKKKQYRFLVSLSHEKEFAVAVVISEKLQ